MPSALAPGSATSRREPPPGSVVPPVGVALVGAGYWGPNLLRNFCASPRAEVRWMCDLDLDRAGSVVGRYSTVRVTDDFDEVLADGGVEAVVIATPAASHAELGLQALASGRHVLMEKPLATCQEDGRRLVEAAAERDLVLMCDHTYCFTPAVQEMRRLIHGGVVGDVHYVDSVRINLGLIRPDTDVIWDLAPHDLAILDFILTDEQRPSRVSAFGVDPVGAGRACVGYLSLPLGDDALAHLHVNWLSPTKVRRMIVGGSERMVVWDDLQPTQRLNIYDAGVDLGDATEDERRELRVAYRMGTIVAPALVEAEALRAVVEEFTGAIREHRPALTDGSSGLRVLELLEAARSSLEDGGSQVAVPPRNERNVA